MTRRSHAVSVAVAAMLLTPLAPAGSQTTIGGDQVETPSVKPHDRPPAPLPLGHYDPVTDADLLNPPADDWLMWRRTYDSWGHSNLKQINRDTVGQLSMVWSRGMDSGAQVALPLIHDGIAFLPEPGGEAVRAVDATTGDLIWEHKRALPKELDMMSRRTRHLALYGNMVYHATGDAHVIALDARTGKQIWDVTIRDWREGATQTAGPLIVKGMVVLPPTCLPYRPDGGKPGPQCFITAIDANSGKLLWKRSTMTTPDDPNDKSWNGVPYESRWPASAWMAGSYDPKTDLIYWGTGSGRPYPSILKGTGEGDLLYTNSTLALRPADGSIAWYFQHHRKDEFDIDHVFERILVDTVVAPDHSEVKWISPKVKAGQRRHVITGIPGKDGLVWTLDRETGEFLWARPTTFQNVTLDIDVTTGKRIENKAIRNVKLGASSMVCPYPAGGGKNWPAGSYSPEPGAIIMPLGNACADAKMTVERTKRDFGPGVGGGQTWKPRPTPDGNRNVGRIEAISVSTGKTLWKYEQSAPVMSILSTGGLVFFGDMNRRFKALDEKTGKVVWNTILGGAVSGFPVTYAVDGRQYIAVASGGGTVLDMLTDGILPDLDLRPGSNMLYVFALPSKGGQ